MPSASLLISTYNWPEALELCLKSVQAQSILPNEILIADDGSKTETKRVIDGFRIKIPVPIKHVWHEDLGFRKTIILNEAIRHSVCDYIIQIDGDIILHPRFVEDHLRHKTEGFFIRGSRTLISKKRTIELIRQNSVSICWADRGLSHNFNSMRSPFLSLLFEAFNSKRSIEGVKGCNFSFWKKDFIGVNGFNNDIVGWGREDSELAIRLINNKVFKKHLKFKAVCFHLHHEIFSRERDTRNMEMLKGAIQERTIWASNGYTILNEHLIFE